MTETMQRLAIQFGEVRALNNDGTTMLLQDKQSGRLMVRKAIAIEQLPIYQTIQGNPCKGLARVEQIFVDGSIAIVLEEYIEGQSIEERLETHGVFSEQEAKRYLAELCDTLHHIHSLHIVHRDISAGNVMIAADNTVKLLDFGISRVPKQDKHQDTTILGTQGYASPEQFGFTQTDERADIYAVGVLLNVMLTGKLPTNTLYAGRLKKVIRRCMEIDPALRYSSVKKVKSALTGEVNEDSSLAMRILRAIPGFRTLTPWKMVVGGCGYLFYLLLILISVPIVLMGPIDAFLILAVHAMVLWVPFQLLTHMGQLWRRKHIWVKLLYIVAILIGNGILISLIMAILS